MKGGMAMIVPNETDQHNTERKKIMKKDELKLLKMSDIQVREVDWLWYPYIPFGKLTIIHGDPGEGKTTFALRLAAACSTGTPLPNMDTIAHNGDLSIGRGRSRRYHQASSHRSRRRPGTHHQYLRGRKISAYVGRKN